MYQTHRVYSQYKLTEYKLIEYKLVQDFLSSAAEFLADLMCINDLRDCQQAKKSGVLTVQCIPHPSKLDVKLKNTNKIKNNKSKTTSKNCLTGYIDCEVQRVNFQAK